MKSGKFSDLFHFSNRRVILCFYTSQILFCLWVVSSLLAHLIQSEKITKNMQCWFRKYTECQLYMSIITIMWPYEDSSIHLSLRHASSALRWTSHAWAQWSLAAVLSRSCLRVSTPAQPWAIKQSSRELYTQEHPPNTHKTASSHWLLPFFWTNAKLQLVNRPSSPQ